MHRQWSIADGPADLTEKDIGHIRTFIESDGTHLKIKVVSIGLMFGGDVRSFSGQITINHHPYEAFGTYNVRDHTGHCQT